MTAPLPTNEADRLDALRGFGVLDTPAEPDYDDLTRLAATICAAPIALVSLVDECRQWFKARHGVDATETHRDVAFCAHAIRQTELFLVPDAAADPRFKDNALVTGGPLIRFYAGMPLATPDGHTLGTLCVIDRVPRTLTDEQADALRVLARQVVAQMLLRQQVGNLKAALARQERAEAELRTSESKLRAFMDNSPAVVFVKDDAGRFVFMNESFTTRLKVAREEWLGKTDFDVWPKDVAQQFHDNDAAVRAGGVPVRLTETSPGRDGSLTHWHVHKFPFTTAEGKQYLAGLAVDMTAERKAEDLLRSSEAKFRYTVDRLAEGLFIVDPAARKFVEANAAMLAMLGYTAAEFLALSVPEIVARETPDVVARTAQHIAAALAKTGRCDLGRKHLRRKDGSEVAVDVRVTAVPCGGAELHAVIVRDVTEQTEYENRLFEYQSELEDANARLKALATTDGLTGVRNRAAFNDTLAEEFDRATRHGRSLSVVLMDVDHFKMFNDTFGHPAGDEVLRAVAATLQKTARSLDVVARYGGEEFAVILPDTDFSGAMVVAERCRRAVAGGAWEQRPVTVSVGVATFTRSTPDAATLVKEADEALYRSKQAGRNRVNHRSGSVPTPHDRTPAVPV